MNCFICRYCKQECIKAGKRNGKQRYRCKQCNRYQQDIYNKKLNYETGIHVISELHKLGLGIRGIASFLKVSSTTIIRKLKLLAAEIKAPEISERNQEYEVDELRTYVGNRRNEIWVIYAINKKTKKVIDFVVGRRTKENLKKLIDKILSLNPKKIKVNNIDEPKSSPVYIIKKVYTVTVKETIIDHNENTTSTNTYEHTVEE